MNSSPPSSFNKKNKSGVKYIKWFGEPKICKKINYMQIQTKYLNKYAMLN